MKRNNVLNTLVFLAIIGVLFFIGTQLGSAIASPTQPQSKPDTANVGSGAGVVNPPYMVKDFTLTDQRGQSLSLSALKGKVTALFFGYTHCPDVCPATLAYFKQVKSQLGAQADNVRFVFISVDAERDTPAVIKDYLGNFDADFIGLTGTDAALQSVAAQFGSAYKIPEHDHNEGEGHKESVASDNYFVEHTSPTYLIDEQGLLRLLYFYGAAPDAITSGVRQLLND